jgi:predicted enzyme related to lactoylglutathione lyase
MFERQTYPAGVPCWVDTTQPDAEAAIAFYSGVFGWEFEVQTPAGSPQPYHIARLRGRDVAGLGSEPSGGPAVWRTYVRVDSADQTAAEVRAAGGRIIDEPVDVADAGRGAVFADPAGAVFGVWEPGRRQGAHLVNEPGTWNFSELNTPDPDGALAFYRRVFRWELSELDAATGGFWRMPGYGDFLAANDPEVRARQADVGAPEGFEDAVAWLIPQRGDPGPGDPAAHWSVTFAVDDADAAAERAAKLGGEVLAPPFDAPWVRMTVLRDPAGAVFTASKFVPPS